MNKIPWGKDRLSGRMVHVDNVPNGKACGVICPGCLALLIAKNYGKIVRHHFAHQGNAAGCDRWTHDTAVELLLQRINDTLGEGDGLAMQWDCDHCRCTHAGDLLKGIDTCKKEQTLNGGSIRPDLVLYGAGQVKKLIEVVDSHAAEFTVHDYAASNAIPLLVIDVSHDPDPDPVVQASPLLPDQVLYVGVCPCGMCQHCNKVRKCEESHRYCKESGECVTDVTDHGGYGSHGHCPVCGKVQSGPYKRNYCCYMQQRYGLPPCPDRDHGHCKSCGQLTKRDRYGLFYEECYPCHQQQRTSQGAREARALERVEGDWYTAYPDWPKPTFTASEDGPLLLQSRLAMLPKERPCAE